MARTSEYMQLEEKFAGDLCTHTRTHTRTHTFTYIQVHGVLHAPVAQPQIESEASMQLACSRRQVHISRTTVRKPLIHHIPPTV